MWEIQTKTTMKGASEPSEMKLPVQYREALIEREGIDVDNRTAEIT